MSKPDFCDELRRLGIGRLADNDQALLVSFSRRPTDDEMCNIDAALDPGHQRFGAVRREIDALRGDLEGARAALRREQDARAELRVELDRVKRELAETVTRALHDGRMSIEPTRLIPMVDAALKAARPDWPYSAWSTGHLIRTGRLGCVRAGKRIYVTPEMLEQFIARHTVTRG